MLHIFEEIVSCIVHAASACRGYTHIADIESVQKLLHNAERWQIILKDYNFVELLNKCDIALYRVSLLPNHCLNHL